ncbi:MAG: hypothetical protein K0Q79_2413 [Flavipsychrobacter sp.]|jgi:hypothetical protein|nr:hypothetical protein [Flavipsychrobacter sp.]
MKYITLLFTAALLSFFTYAQPVVGKMLPKFTIGIKAGLNMQQVSGNFADNAYSSGIVGGIFAGVSKNKIGVQAEGLVRSAKVAYTVPTAATAPTFTVNTVSLDIPVLFQYKIFWRIWAQAGPQFSTLISAKQNSTDVKNNFNTTNFAGVLGLQANLPFRLSVGARYVLGVTNINNESKSAIKGAWNERCIQLSLGFRFL